MTRIATMLLLAATVGCAPTTALPYYVSPDFTPSWTPTAPRSERFMLTTQTGERFTGSDLRGRIHVASFVYTRCSVVCPVLVQRLQALQAAARKWNDVQILSFSVNPEADSPDALAVYARDHQIDARRWLLLTGDASQVYQLARTFYFADDGRLAGTQNDFLHTEKVLLVDREGRLRGIYNGTQKAEIRHLIDDIETLRLAE